MKTKKRILAMLLAVVLCFSALPFSVSADELPGELSTESTVESQLAELPAEKSEESPPPAENTIIISDSSGDVPVLYAQDPFNTVKSEVEGGTSYMTSVGVTRKALSGSWRPMKTMTSTWAPNMWERRPISQRGRLLQQRHRGHELRRFYQLRPPESRPGRGNHHGDHAPDAGESVRLRLALRLVGRGLQLQKPHRKRQYQRLRFPHQAGAAEFWLGRERRHHLDVVEQLPWCRWGRQSHWFFWGEASDDDVMWHSGTEPSSGNQISEITPKTPGSFYILIKIEPLQPKEYTVT